jgi:hypothetical protein
MIFKKITLSGFDRMYDGYRDAYNANMLKGYTSGLFNFLEHSMISIDLDSITTIELFHLKSLASNVSILGKDIENFTNDSKYSDITGNIQALIDIHQDMLVDDDIDEKTDSIDMVLPIGCQKYHVLAVFKGAAITSITGPMIDKLFYIDNKFSEVYPGDVMVGKQIAMLFYKRLYGNITDAMKNLDIVTSYVIDKKFYKYADGDCDLAHVNTPYGQLVFFGNSDDRLNYQISELKKRQEELPYVLNDQVYLTFVLTTTFSSFMKLYMDTNYIVDYEDLKVIYTLPDINLSDNILNKYSARINDAYGYIAEFKSNLSKSDSDEIDLNRLNFIFNGNMIKYSIQLSLKDIDRISYIFNDNIELSKIKNSIVTTSKVISNIME